MFQGLPGYDEAARLAFSKWNSARYARGKATGGYPVGIPLIAGLPGQSGNDTKEQMFSH